MILSDRTLFKMLEAGRRVGQLVFAEMDDTALKPYNGKYQGRRVPPGRGIYGLTAGPDFRQRGALPGTAAYMIIHDGERPLID